MLDSGSAFNLLSAGMRQWVARQGWPGFRDIQAQAIEKLLSDDSKTPPNLVISAPTGQGKTEAAFIPALSILQSYYEQNKEDRFCCMLYVAPLKALINDQYRRLSDMAKDLNIPVYLWHGDAPQGQKNRMLKEHDGIIMITPESLESFLMNRGEWCNAYMTPKIIIIDEFHAFLGEGRGKQLLSLLSRIDMINISNGQEPAIRIGLSATLSQLDLVGSILSPDAPFEIVDGTGGGNDEMDIEVLTFDPPVKHSGQTYTPKEDDTEIGCEIIRQSIGEKTLTFAGSRMQVETIASTINSICKANNIESEAFPHHGSLAKDIREELEQRLVSTDKPTMAVATVTLELGIDIGDIYKVFQVGTTNSVASLRQRVGRSGRRDGHKRVCCLVTTGKTPMEMEEDLATTIVEIELMNAGWFEPPNAKHKDVSVLVSEILSVVRQYGSAYSEELYAFLVQRGAFRNIEEDLFTMVIDNMVAADFLEYTPDKQLMIGGVGEAETNDWHFYAVFQSEDAFKVVSGQKTIGEITPPSTALLPLSLGGMFMLGGRYWQVIPPINMKGRVINVKQVNVKSKFLIPTSRGAGDVCGAIKRARIRLLSGDDSDFVPYYLDDYGKEKLEAARKFAQAHHLNGLGLSIYDAGEKGSETDSEVARRAAEGYHDNALVRVDPPVDVAAYNAIVKTLEAAGMEPGGLENIPIWRLKELIDTVIADWGAIEANKENLIDDAMLDDIKNSEKYNPMLTNEVLRYAYIDERIDLAGARKWFDAFERFYTKVIG